MTRLKLLLIIFLTLSLTGCAQNNNMTEEQTDIVSEYMAGLILKYDSSYRPKLVSAKELGETEAIKVSSDNNEDNNKVNIEDNDKNNKDTVKDNNVNTPSTTLGEAVNKENTEVTEKDYTLTEVIGIKGFKIDYTDYKVLDSLTDNDYFILSASEGKQLLVTYFSIKNKLNEDAELNLTKTKIQYLLETKGETIYYPIMTVLDNDLQLIDKIIGGGKKDTAVLIFEIPNEFDLTDVNLIISNDNKKEIIKIK